MHRDLEALLLREDVSLHASLMVGFDLDEIPTRASNRPAIGAGYPKHAGEILLSLRDRFWDNGLLYESWFVFWRGAPDSAFSTELQLMRSVAPIRVARPFQIASCEDPHPGIRKAHGLHVYVWQQTGPMESTLLGVNPDHIAPLTFEEAEKTVVATTENMRSRGIDPLAFFNAGPNAYQRDPEFEIVNSQRLEADDLYAEWRKRVTGDSE
jgi:hypothetical protein